MSEHPRFGSMPDFGGSISVGPATVDSISEVRDLQRDSFIKLNARHFNDSEIDALEGLLLGDAHAAEIYAFVRLGRLLEARLQRRLVGAIAWSGGPDGRSEARLRFVCIDPLFARGGIGRALVQEAEHRAHGSGMRTMSTRSLVAASGFSTSSATA